MPKDAGRHSRPDGWPILHIVFDIFAFGFDEDRETVRGQINRVLRDSSTLYFA